MEFEAIRRVPVYLLNHLISGTQASSPYLWVTCVSRFVGKLMMLIALNGHRFGQIPHLEMLANVQG